MAKFVVLKDTGFAVPVEEAFIVEASGPDIDRLYEMSQVGDVDAGARIKRAFPGAIELSRALAPAPARQS